MNKLQVLALQRQLHVFIGKKILCHFNIIEFVLHLCFQSEQHLQHQRLLSKVNSFKDIGHFFETTSPHEVRAKTNSTGARIVKRAAKFMFRKLSWN